MSATNRETQERHVRGMIDAMEEALPKDCAGLCLVFHRDGNGNLELGHTTASTEVVLLMLKAAIEAIVKKATGSSSKIIRPKKRGLS